MAGSKCRNPGTHDPRRAFERIRREMRSIRSAGDPHVARLTDTDARIEIHEDEEGFLLVAWPVAEPLGQVDFTIEWNEVQIALPTDGLPADSCRPRRIRLPAAVDPDRTEMIYSSGTLLLRLVKRSLRRAHSITAATFH